MGFSVVTDLGMNADDISIVIAPVIDFMNAFNVAFFTTVGLKFILVLV